MHTFISFIAKVLVSPLILALSLAGYSVSPQKYVPPPQSQIRIGAFNPTGGGTYRLQTSLSSTGTSLTLTSFKEPVSNITYTMSYLNSTIEYATIEPQSTNKEFVSFTGITQNSDGTATLTGLTRGLGFSYPYTASSTLQVPHSGQSILILSNPPQLTNQYANKNNTETISGTWTFNLLPESATLATTSNQFVNKSYADGLSFNGVATATESSFGGVWLSTALRQASSTDGTPNKPYVLQSKYASSSPSFPQTVSALTTIISDNRGLINPMWIATTSSDIYRFAGQFFHTASTSLNSTTTISAALGSKLMLNNVNYVYPSTQGASSTALYNDGSGNLSWGNFEGWQQLASTSLSVAAQSMTVTVPARSDYHIVLAQSGVAAPSGTTTLQFNSDNSTNYGHRQSVNNAAFTTGSSVTAIHLNQGNSDSFTFWIDVENTLGAQKPVVWSGIEKASGATAPAYWEGAGTWNNTSSRITTILATTTTGNFPVGSRLTVYGSPN